MVVLGSSNTDMIVRVPNLPAPGETVLGGRFAQAAGGKGANQAVAAARAGGDVRFIGCVGDDDLGRKALMGLEADGIDTSGVSTHATAPSGVALVFVGAGGENSIAVASGANIELTPTAATRHASAIASATLLLMQLESPLETVEAAARLAHAAGTRVVLDPAPAQMLPDSLLECISILTPNSTEAGQLTGLDVRGPDEAVRAAEQLMDRGAASVIVTLGADGAIWCTPDSSISVEGHPVEAVDTTGAGDVFSGSLVAALAGGASEPDALAFANAAAALSVTQPGAQPAIPHLQAILALLGEAD